MALPTKGRVIIDTTVGEIDIELWSKETPKTCRNFIALAMEGYYDGVIFHRIVPGFLVQTGDRTGTGNGGESFYGEPFEDEIHPRLRYAHRGIVGMANNGDKDSNDSQFFITLDRADELHGKHTLFGRCMGDTVYNVMKIGEMEIDKDNRPVYPPKIKSIRIIDNPFDDIVPRITAAERRAQLKAREEAQKEREEEQRRRGAKKNVKLLSFGEDEGGEEEEEPVVFKKKAIFRPDLLDATPATGASTGIPLPDFVTNPQPTPTSKPKRDEPSSTTEPSVQSSSKTEGKNKGKAKADEVEDITKIREKHAKEKDSAADSHKAQIARMEADIRKLTRRTGGHSSDSDSDSHKRKKPKVSYLEEEMKKYSKGRGRKAALKEGKRKDEVDVLGMMESFRDRLKNTMAIDEDEDEARGSHEAGETGGNKEAAGDEVEPEPIDVDDDTGFLSHALHFPKDGNAEEVAKAERDYEVIDPRARGAQAREEERERKRREGKDRPKYGHGAGGGGDRGFRGERDRDRRYGGGDKERDNDRRFGGRGGRK
ncbi:cyclophilin-like protein [Coprinellus micaceus]|uniref:Peptidyl-prolyl isomerase CWC27 n=1 Tax=Coprinellus micaceus TaxID=71717 RepID=A0A4Y7TG29_COPMI|nr:cyclophilin-like protein [Coprinellus micaceus]